MSENEVAPGDKHPREDSETSAAEILAEFAAAASILDAYHQTKSSKNPTERQARIQKLRAAIAEADSRQQERARQAELRAKEASAKSEETQASFDRVLQNPEPGDTPEVRIAKIKAKADCYKTDKDNEAALRKIEADERVAQLQLTVARQEGENELAVERERSATQRAVAAEAKAEKYKLIGVICSATIGLVGVLGGAYLNRKPDITAQSSPSATLHANATDPSPPPSLDNRVVVMAGSGTVHEYLYSARTGLFSQAENSPDGGHRECGMAARSQAQQLERESVAFAANVGTRVGLQFLKLVADHESSSSVPVLAAVVRDANDTALESILTDHVTHARFYRVPLDRSIELRGYCNGFSCQDVRELCTAIKTCAADTKCMVHVPGPDSATLDYLRESLGKSLPACNGVADLLSCEPRTGRNVSCVDLREDPSARHARWIALGNDLLLSDTMSCVQPLVQPTTISTSRQLKLYLYGTYPADCATHACDIPLAQCEFLRRLPLPLGRLPSKSCKYNPFHKLKPGEVGNIPWANAP